MLYGDVDFIHLEGVLEAEMDEQDGNPDLIACLKEASIELAEWLQAPWYYRLVYHGHKIYKMASNVEKARRHSILAERVPSAAGKRVLEEAGML